MLLCMGISVWGLPDTGILLRQCKIRIYYPQTTHLTFDSYRLQNTEIASDQNAANLWCA